MYFFFNFNIFPSEFAEIIKSIVNGADSSVRHLPAVEDDPQKRRPDISRAKKMLNWEPKISLVDGLRKTVDYFRREVIRSSTPIFPDKREGDSIDNEKELW